MQRWAVTLHLDSIANTMKKLYTVSILFVGFSEVVTAQCTVTASPLSEICFGQTTTQLSATANPTAVSYSWVPSTGLSCTTCPNPIANPPSTYIYTVYTSDANSCTAFTTDTVVVSSIPMITAMASPTICIGETVQLVANTTNLSCLGPCYWNWYPPNSPPLNSDTLQNPTITPNVTTNLMVVVTNSSGCKDTGYTTVFVIQSPPPCGAGVKNIHFSESIIISPNPFSTQTTLQTENSFRNATLTVYNSFGQKVKEERNISGNEIIFSRNNLPSGLYFIRLTENDKFFATEKLIITDY